ncbi:MAG: DMT family transporter [Spirochaetes bacterium]|nr:DMT family transporter [Spirochaetota bacterium]
MSESRASAYTAGVVTALAWGLSFLSIKVSVAVLPPMTLGLARFVIASALLLAIVAVMGSDAAGRRGLSRLRFEARDFPSLAGAGLVGVTIYFLCENNGVLLLSASESSIIIGTIPVITMLSERLFLGTRLAKLQYFGSALSAGGVILIVAESLHLSAAPIGYLFMLGAALSWVGYSFITRPALARYGRIETTFWQSVFGAAGFLPFVIFERTDWSRVDGVIVLNVLFLGIVCSALGYLLYVHNLKILGAGVASVFINLIPVVSVVSSFFILGERMSGFQVAGAVVVIAGVWLATTGGKRPVIEDPRA